MFYLKEKTKNSQTPNKLKTYSRVFRDRKEIELYVERFLATSQNESINYVQLFLISKKKGNLIIIMTKNVHKTMEKLKKRKNYAERR